MSKRLLLLAFFLTLSLGWRSAFADTLASCQTVSVVSILGTSCSIGDATYQFGISAWTGSLSASDVLFTPDDTNPDSPGFILSPNISSVGPLFSLTGGATSVQNYPAILGYTAAITDPSPGEAIVGDTGTETHEAVSVTGSGNGVAQGISLMSFPPPCTLNTILVTGFDFSGSGSFATFFNTSNLVQGSPGCSEVTQTTADAEILLQAQNATTSLASAGFYIDETGVPDATMTSATPEPNSLVLMGSGLLGLAGVVRRRVSGSYAA